MKNRIFLIMIMLLLLICSAMAGPLDSEEKISLQFEDIDLSTALSMLADQYGLNLIQSGQVE